MCGIVGYNLDVAGGMEHCMITNHRGPDKTELNKYSNFSLGHNRLSIIDLSERSNQPFISDDGNYVIVFNGEVYNFQALRDSLKEKYQFRTNSDTEVVLYSFIEKGEYCLQDFIGMFAFSIYDIRRDRLFCARDRFGIKPFFFYESDGKFAFASEIKVIKSLLGGSLKVDESIYPYYFHYLRIPVDRSIYSDIQKLQPGHYLIYENGQSQKHRYWNLQDYIDVNHGLSEEEILSKLDDLLNDAVKLRMIADVELGSFLSGGIDSTLILKYMAENSDKPINTFTVGFDIRTKYDERSDAKLVADYFKSNHRDILIKPNIIELLPKLVYHFDEPYGNSMALLTYELTKKVKESATVALAGDGADEIFGGYPRYEAFNFYNKSRFIPRSLIRVAARVLNILPESSTGNHSYRRIKIFFNSLSKPEHEMYNDWVSYFTDSEINQLLMSTRAFTHSVGNVYKEVKDCNHLHRASVTDLSTFLPANLLVCADRMAMANSFESRLPLIDHRIAEFMISIEDSWKIKNGDTKYLLRKLLQGKVPKRILEKPKWGFTSPMGSWLKNDLNKITTKYLSKETLDKRGILNSSFVANLLGQHKSGRRDRSSFIWSLMVFEEWCKQNLD